MLRISKPFAFLLIVILLLAQTEWLGLGAASGRVVGAEVALSLEQDAAPHSDSSNSSDLGSHCNHGCHLQNHFVGSIVQPTLNWLARASDVAPALVHTSHVPNALVEALYRPPRFSPLA